MKNFISLCTFAALSLAGTAFAFHFAKAQDNSSGLPPIAEISKIDAVIIHLMEKENVPGIALAIIDNGNVHTVKSYGLRDIENNEALNNDTVMYAASITKFVFATFVLQLVDEGKIDLDKSIADYLPKPLPDYEDYADLADDVRWRKLTLRMLLSHSTGFPNYRFFPPEGGYDPEGKLKFYYEPGNRYGYSGEGYYIAQLVVEEALNIKTGEEIQKRYFDRLGMKRTGLTWRDDFMPNISIGYEVDGKRYGHNRRSNVRAAGSMDTSIHDLAAWTSAFMQGKILSAETRGELLAPQIAITSKYQFPTLDTTIDKRNEQVRLTAGLGVITWHSAYGLGFSKGGHNEVTDNMLLCLEAERRCVVLLSNTAKGDKVFPEIVAAILGETNMPWRWLYPARDIIE